MVLRVPTPLLFRVCVGPFFSLGWVARPEMSTDAPTSWRSAEGKLRVVKFLSLGKHRSPSPRTSPDRRRDASNSGVIWLVMMRVKARGGFYSGRIQPAAPTLLRAQTIDGPDAPQEGAEGLDGTTIFHQVDELYQLLRRGLSKDGKKEIANATPANRAIRLVRLSWLRKKAALARAAPDTESRQRQRLALLRRQQLEAEDPGAFLDVKELIELEKRSATKAVSVEGRTPVGAWS